MRNYTKEQASRFEQLNTLHGDQAGTLAEYDAIYHVDFTSMSDEQFKAKLGRIRAHLSTVTAYEPSEQ